MVGMAVVLGRVCRRAREHADLRQIEVAEVAGVSEATISLFERGTAWRQRTDEIVIAYEHACGLSDGELWRRAASELP